MKKLDNKGWGLVTFLVFMAILFVALFVVVILVNYFGTGLKNSQSHIIYDEPGIEDYNYPAYESTMIDYARKYKIDKNIVLSDGQSININKNDLNILRSKYNHCSGYVKITNEFGAEVYQAYIDCGDYKTIGYE